MRHFRRRNKNETGKELNKDKDYISLELITKDKKVTNAGLLLSDQGLLIQSRIFCTRWKGLVKGSVDGDAIDDKEYTHTCNNHSNDAITL